MAAALRALSFGNFMIATGTMIVPGMLPVLAQGLGVSVPVAGGLITAFAVTIAVTAPILAAATSRWDRRRLLVGAQLFFVACHVVSAFLSGFTAMLVLRAITSLAAGLYTAQAAATAGRLVAPEARGRAIAFVFLGWAVASVVGLPVGAFLGQAAGWRAGFLFVALGSLVAAVTLQAFLPAGVRVEPIARTAWRALARQPQILMVIGVTVASGSAQFAVFSYFVPAIQSFVHASPVMVSALLGVFGAAGVAGNVAGGQLADRFGAPRVVVALIGSMAAGHALWIAAPGALPVLIVSLLAWGAGCFSSNSVQQARLATIAPALAPVSIALNSSAIYLGQAIGTSVGGAILGRADGPALYAAPVWFSLPAFAGAIALSLAAERAGRRSQVRADAMG